MDFWWRTDRNRYQPEVALVSSWPLSLLCWMSNKQAVTDTPLLQERCSHSCLSVQASKESGNHQNLFIWGKTDIRWNAQIRRAELNEFSSTYSSSPCKHDSNHENGVTTPQARSHLHYHINEIMPCVWLLSFGIMFWDSSMLLPASICCSFLWPSNSLLHEPTTICLSIQLLMVLWVIYSLELLWVKLLWTFMCKSLWGHVFSFPLG